MHAPLSQASLVPGRRPLFSFGDIVLWREEEPARIYSDPLVYERDYFYDIQLHSTGQLILAVEESDIERLIRASEPETVV